MTGRHRLAGWLKIAIILLGPVVVIAVVPLSPLIVYFTYDAVSRHRFYARTPLVSDLDGPLLSDEERHFAERVEGTFPIGSLAGRVEGALIEQGFSPLPAYGGFQSRYRVERASLPCRLRWDVLWSAEAGTVSNIRGEMTATCL